jgi:uncharacterized membrane protein YhaH (DUF805 family)
MFKAPFSFEGRIRRTEYGITMIIYAFIYVFIIFMAESNGTFIYILVIPTLWFIWAQGAKRCHDLGKSGMWQIIPFYALWMLFADGEHGLNEYGYNPKGLGNNNEIDEIGNYLK